MSFCSLALLAPLAQAQDAAGLSLEVLGTHALAAGLAACWLVALCKMGELTGNAENISQLPPERKLPHDSDMMVAGVLFAIGAVIGVVVAFVLQANGADPQAYWPVSLAPGVAIGLFIPWPFVRLLGRQYLERAITNMEQGNYKEALQDAKEVERISESLKPEARAIIEEAQELRGDPLGGKLPGVSLHGASSDDPNVYASIG